MDPFLCARKTLLFSCRPAEIVIQKQRILRVETFRKSKKINISPENAKPWPKYHNIYTYQRIRIR